MKGLNRPTSERLSVIRNQASQLLWYGKIETTLAKSKEVASFTEKILTDAINTYTDTVKVVKTVVDEKGTKINKEVVNDGPKKLAARRRIMNKVHNVQEVRAPKEAKTAFIARTKDIKHPLIEKIFNVYAPKYAKRNETLNIGGGYTRILKLGNRNGDAGETVLIELV